MSVPTEIPDLAITSGDAQELLESPAPIHPWGNVGGFVYEGRPFSGQLKNEPSLANFLRQAMAIGIHETAGNTNPWHGPNTFHVRLEGDNVAVWSDENPGPTPLSASRNIDAEYYAREDAKANAANAAPVIAEASDASDVDEEPELVDDDEEEDDEADTAKDSASKASRAPTRHTRRA